MRRFLLLLSLLSLSVSTTLAAGAESGSHPGAVLVNLTEQDLNRILRDAFHANGGPVFEGRKHRISRSIFDLHYLARLSDPVAEVGEDGRVSIHVDIRQADVHIGRIERRLVGRRARCEDVDIRLHDDRSLGVDLDLQFLVDEAGLHIVPVGAATPGARRAFRLTKPARCRKLPLPKWLMWWIGKPRLRRQLDRLDDRLLEQARRSATDLAEDGGLLRESWPLAASVVELVPRNVDTSRGSLLIGFEGRTAPRTRVTEDRTVELPLLAPETHLAIAEPLVNEVLELAFTTLNERSARPSGDFRKLFRSDAVFALVPGLRELPATDDLYVNFRFGAPPRLRFGSILQSEAGLGATLEAEPPAPQAERATIAVELHSIEMELRQPGEPEDRPLGTLLIESGTVRVVPYVSRMGGISFEPLTNEWRLSSTGIEFDEPLLAATIQELVFGELFETRFEPLARRGFAIGDSRFRARSFQHVDDYLVISFEQEPSDAKSVTARALPPHSER